MAARDDVRFIHDIEEETVAVPAHFAEDVVLRPQQPGPTRSMTDPGMDRPARLTPKPWAPGELKARAAGEL